MLKKIKLYYNTIRSLGLSQIYYQVFYKLKPKSFVIDEPFDVNYQSLIFNNVLNHADKYKSKNSFEFLNLYKSFDKEINWNYLDFGKLWNYNLEYFDYLFQENISNKEKLKLINSFYNFSENSKRVLEPYPVSLRAINIIKFFSLNDIKDDTILNSLYQELEFLNKNL